MSDEIAEVRAHPHKPWPKCACAGGYHFVEADAAIDTIETALAEANERISDIVAHATPFGDIPDDPGWTGTYLLTAGALHKAMGTLGHSEPSCQAETALAERDREIERLKDADRDVTTLVTEIGFLSREAESHYLHDALFHAAVKIAHAEHERAERAEGIIEYCLDRGMIPTRHARAIYDAAHPAEDCPQKEET